MNQETSVVKKEKGGALAASIFESDAAAGLGNVGHEDLALPFLKILGQLSPETNKRDGKYVEGAEPGMIYNTVTGELFDVRVNQRIVNFRHNIITLHRSSIIDNRRYDRLQQVKLSTGEVLNSPPVPIYFLEKFEGTGWENYLNSQLK